jgi:ketosteroid isomerase-like protein
MPYALQTKQRHAYAAAAEQSVTKLEQEWFADQLALNWPKLKSMIAEDFVLTESDGKLGNRETMLEGYKTEASLTSDIKMTFLVTHAVAADAVIATGLDDITLKGKDGRVNHRYERFTDTWILRDGRWQCVAEQLTLGQP